MEKLPQSIRDYLRSSEKFLDHFTEKEKLPLIEFSKTEIEKLKILKKSELENPSLTLEERVHLKKFDPREAMNVMLIERGFIPKQDWKQRLMSNPNWKFLARLFIDRNRFEKLLQRLISVKDDIRKNLDRPDILKEIGVWEPKDMNEEILLNDFLSAKDMYIEMLQKQPQSNVDELLQQIVSLMFDVDEPGYNAAMQKGFEFVFQSIGEKWGATEFESLHRLCVGGVLNTRSNHTFRKGFREEGEGAAFGFDINKVTSAAEKENIEKKLIWGEGASYKDIPVFLAMKGPFVKGSVIAIYTRCNDHLQEKVQSFFDEYYQEIENASTRREKLRAIVNLARKLEILHPFYDGNQRTIAFALMTKLLIENGMSPAILEEPAMFDGYFSTEEMVDAVEKGMEHFQRRYQEFVQK